MRVLVTGSSGLIGSEAVEFYDGKGYTVYGIDNNMRAMFFGPKGDTLWNLRRLQRSTRHFTHCDLDIRDRQMVLHVANGNLDAKTDSGFNLGPNDNLVLLAPGPTPGLDDDQGIAFVSKNTVVTPTSFGVLVDGVLPAH